MEHQRLTNKEVKKKNRNQIFRYICTHGTVSNPDIVSDLHLSLPTVTNTTRELLESGLLRDLGEMQSTGGRRARALCAASDYRFSLGLDITRNHLGILLLNLIGDIIKHERIQLGFSRSSAYFSEVCQKIDDFLLETEISGEQILGLGISLPGIVDPVQKMITFVFMSNVGSFTTPYLMGGNSPKMLGIALYDQFNKYLSYNRSAALSVIMFMICSVSAAVYIYTNLKEKDWEK